MMIVKTALILTLGVAAGLLGTVMLAGLWGAAFEGGKARWQDEKKEGRKPD